MTLVDNGKIADAFEELADLSDLGGHNPHKSRAYRAFAETARGLDEPIKFVWLRGEVGKLPGVGKAISSKIDEIFRRGSFDALDRARLEVPRSLLELLRVKGLGIRRVRALWQGLGVTSLGELAYACRENRLITLPGFGPKTQAGVLEAVTFLLESADAVVLGRALDIAGEVIEIVRGAGALRVDLAGEARRGAILVREIVVVASGIDAGALSAALEASPSFSKIERSDGESLLAFFEGRTPVRLHLVDEREHLRALFEETGDAAHLRSLEERAQSLGRDLDALMTSSESEGEVYRALDLPPLPPELREGPHRAAPQEFLERGGLSGIFHAHTDWSDGTSTVLAMAKATQALGFAYLGISDHSKAAVYARGLDGERLRRQAIEIAKAQRALEGFTILHGVEVDILRDGSLDLDDDALASLDFVIASVHSSMGLSSEEMTARLVRAASHPLVTMLGHPTGRLLLGRQGFAFDFEAVVEACVKNDTYLEINASRYRLDLDDSLVQKAAKLGARFSINPDAHSPGGIIDAELGVIVARRAGLSATQVLNAAPAEAVVAELSARKERALLRLAEE